MRNLTILAAAFILAIAIVLAPIALEKYQSEKCIKAHAKGDKSLRSLYEPVCKAR